MKRILLLIIAVVCANMLFAQQMGEISVYVSQKIKADTTFNHSLFKITGDKLSLISIYYENDSDDDQECNQQFNEVYKLNSNEIEYLRRSLKSSIRESKLLKIVTEKQYKKCIKQIDLDKQPNNTNYVLVKRGDKYYMLTYKIPNAEEMDSMKESELDMFYSKESSFSNIAVIGKKMVRRKRRLFRFQF